MDDGAVAVAARDGGEAGADVARLRLALRREVLVEIALCDLGARLHLLLEPRKVLAERHGVAQVRLCHAGLLRLVLRHVQRSTTRVRGARVVDSAIRLWHSQGLGEWSEQIFQNRGEGGGGGHALIAFASWMGLRCSTMRRFLAPFSLRFFAALDSLLHWCTVL